MKTFKLGSPIKTEVEVGGEDLPLSDFFKKSGLEDLFGADAECSLGDINFEKSNLNGVLCLTIKPLKYELIKEGNLSKYSPNLSKIGRDYLIRYDERFIVYIQNPME